MNNPSIIQKKEYSLSPEDFMGERHILLFTCIYNLVQQGLKKITIGDIETYLDTNDLKGHDLLFNNEQNFEWLDKVYEDANISNYEYYYGIVRKMSLLRAYLEENIDVRSILDMDEIDHIIIKNQNEKFDLMTIEDIKSYFDRKIINIKRKFNGRDEDTKRKSGEGGKELREMLKEAPNYGFNLESGYLNTITRGALPKKFFLETRDSGCGKTRVALKRLTSICSPYIWDFKTKDYIINPNGINNSGLYIGTEMDLYEELEPILWSVISEIEEDRIRANNLTQEEEERLDKAIEYADEMQLYMEDESN
jgi:replicative DNA helicase